MIRYRRGASLGQLAGAAEWSRCCRCYDLHMRWQWRMPDMRKWARLASQECDQFCEEWIGWSLPPVAKAIEESGWRPADRTRYCHRCGETVGLGEADGRGCGSCRDKPISSDGIVRLGTYSDSLRAWVLEIKYARWIQMGWHLGGELGRALRQAHVIDLERAVVVPMPMPWLRRVHRGIDHAEVLGLSVARELGVPLLRVLAKSNGPTQLTVPKGMRRINARRGMRVRRRIGGWPLQGRHVILVDDVRTTGSSLGAATRLLRPLRVGRVIEAVVAVAERARRTADGAMPSDRAASA